MYNTDSMKPKICVFANQKGGVGKTTSAVSLGAYIAEAGKRVLLIDFDPQGNLTSSIGIDGSGPGIYEALTGNAEFIDVVQKTESENLWGVSSNINLTGANVELIEVEDREYFLKNTINGSGGEWDYIFIDSPPSLGILTINGLAAADYVMVPLQCEYFALEGLSLLLQTIQKIQKGANPGLKLGGIFFTMYDSRTRLAHEVVEEVTALFGDRVFRTIIPRNVRLSEAPSHSKTINRYDPGCIGAKSYQKLALEVMERV